MGARSTIEWTDATWNPTRGCARISEGCRNCYAERIAARFCAVGQPFFGYAERSPMGGRWTGEASLVPDALEEPLHWRRRRNVFVNSMSDIFHHDIGDHDIAAIFGVMLAAHRRRGHVFQLLTKRPERMASVLGTPAFWTLANMRADIFARLHGVEGEPFAASAAAPPEGIWLGTSTEHQAAADARIPALLETPAALRFVSCEPLLGAMAIRHHLLGRHRPGGVGIDWVIAGGESGPGARPAHPDWIRGLRDQCTAADVPFFFKQWGAWQTVYDRDRDDPDWRRCPREQDHPGSQYLNLAGGRGFHGERVVFVRRTSVKEAGALLDGRTWREMPA